MTTESERWKELVSNHLAVPANGVTDDASLFDDLEVDSLDTIELVMLAEDEFGIEITDEEAEVCQTFGDTLRLIASKTSEPAT